MKAELAGLSKQERKIIGHFSANEMVKVDADDLIEAHPCKRETANQILGRLARKGWLQRLKRGVYTQVPLYSLTPDPVIEEAWPLAMNLFFPAFISGWSSAEHWDLTEQIFNSICVITTTSQRKVHQTIGGIAFRTKTIKNDDFFGTKKVWFGSTPVDIADPSRMIIDILDLPQLGGGGRHSIDILTQYWRSDLNDPDLLLEYAVRYNRGSVFKRLGFLTEEIGAPVPPEWIELCRKNISTGISNLDPDVKSIGKIVSKWNLRVNLPI